MTWSEMSRFAVIAGLVVKGIPAIGGAEDSPAAGQVITQQQIQLLTASCLRAEARSAWAADLGSLAASLRKSSAR